MTETFSIHGSMVKRATLIPERRCEKCDVSDENREKFFVCSGCKWATYCSKACQKDDWKKHKSRCRPPLNKKSKYSPDEPGPSDRQVNPDGLSMCTLHQNLYRWKKHHKPKFMLACIHGLGLHSDWARVRTHVLHVRVHARPEREHKGVPGKFFRVVDAEAVPVEDSPSCAGLDVSEWCREDEEDGKGATTTFVLELPGMAPSVMPFAGVMKELLSTTSLGNWKQVFMADILEGGTAQHLFM